MSLSFALAQNLVQHCCLNLFVDIKAVQILSNVLCKCLVIFCFSIRRNKKLVKNNHKSKIYMNKICKALGDEIRILHAVQLL